jgi:hypothetical protein
VGDNAIWLEMGLTSYLYVCGSSAWEDAKGRRAPRAATSTALNLMSSSQGNVQVCNDGNFQKSGSLSFHVASWHKGHVLFVLQIYIHNYKSIYHPHQLQ